MHPPAISSEMHHSRIIHNAYFAAQNAFAMRVRSLHLPAFPFFLTTALPSFGDLCGDFFEDFFGDTDEPIVDEDFAGLDF